MEFLGNVFTNLIFENRLSHEVKRWGREELQLPVTIKRCVSSSYK